ncbi:amino acid ABC transporter permease [Thermopetrobacter sp. TC1]|uniref:amino acid ABC transporter permease n=1 Tax=Thermopetrobacter sp. TC1 TaxID=1495045 RepID=UPI0005706902|nr:amino acid ABC transporter permease [Thermopetrobacter sp. TC1]
MTDTVKEHKRSFYRTEMLPPKPPPPASTGVLGWMRENLFSSWWHTILTFVGLYIIWLIVSFLVQFAIIDAVWSGQDRTACLADGGREIGACWAFIRVWHNKYMFGFYPEDQQWRVLVVYAIGAVLLAFLLIPRAPGKRLVMLLLFVIYPVLAYILLYGMSSLGLPVIETTRWGGLMLTLVIAAVGIVISLPLGILFALGRRSQMPVIRFISIIFIEFWRGVPLITVLFMSSVMLPLFLPEGVTLDKVIRPLVGVALFASAYMAEVVRGGLQAIPKGQYEGAQALGLTYWQMMLLIILPQALKMVIPGIVNTFIGLFKDTSLVSIIGLFDLLGIAQASLADAKWATPVTAPTVYLYLALVYWVFCFGMSRYSIFMENYLHTGHKR